MRKLTCTLQKSKLSVIGISLGFFFTEKVSYGNPPQIIIYLASEEVNCAPNVITWWS